MDSYYSSDIASRVLGDLIYFSWSLLNGFSCNVSLMWLYTEIIASSYDNPNVVSVEPLQFS